MKMEEFLDRLSDWQMLNKVLCFLVGYKMQYYFYTNGLFSNAFSVDGRQTNMNETAALGESLVTGHSATLCTTDPTLYSDIKAGPPC
jgi:hypothetical protein